MPKGLLQEKFQTTLPDPKTDGSNSWVVGESNYQHQHDTRHMRVTSDRPGAGSQVDFDTPRTNDMPPGMFIDNQMPQVNDRVMQYVPAGATDVSNKVGPSMMKHGFSRLPMLGTDDLYTNEHTEEFYGEAKGSDDAGNNYAGYLERNNYLDRN